MLLEIREDFDMQGEPSTARQEVMIGVVRVQGDPQLMQVVRTLNLACRFPRSLDGGQ